MRTYCFSLLISSLTLLLPTLMAHAEREIDLSTPEAAIMTYCTAQDRETQNTVLCCGIKFDGPLIPYRDCTIVAIGPAHDVGEQDPDPDIGLIRPDDVEVITEITSLHPDKGDVRRRFWYMLRDFGGEWKIISWYYIPDENFPDIDT